MAQISTGNRTKYCNLYVPQLVYSVQRKENEKGVNINYEQNKGGTGFQELY